MGMTIRDGEGAYFSEIEHSFLPKPNGHSNESIKSLRDLFPAACGVNYLDEQLYSQKS